MRFGFAVKVVGRPALKSHDARRWQSDPHLSVSIGYLHAILDYLDEIDVRMYRIASNVVPYATHPDLPAFARQLDECADGLARLGEHARRLDVRLSTHPSQYIVLNAVDPAIVDSAIRELDHQARLLDLLGTGPEAVVVIHGGGGYGDRSAALDRWVRGFERLSPAARARLVLENDERVFDLADVLALSERTGVPVVLDLLHHRILDRQGIGVREGLERAFATWSEGVLPKVHYSSARVEARDVVRRVRATGERRIASVDPLPAQHSDFVDAPGFADFLAAADGLDFDVMLEAKQKDLALLRLRDELRARGLEPETGPGRLRGGRTTDRPGP
jgi:UV DNA damage endonuclease